MVNGTLGALLKLVTFPLSVLTFGIFFTPVFYDASMFGNKGKWLLLNPAGPILDGLGSCIARHQSPNLGFVGNIYRNSKYLALRASMSLAKFFLSL